MDVQHTEECKSAMQQHAEERARYIADWPDHCDECMGWGLFYSSYDPSPAGVALSSGRMLDVDTCSGCLDHNRCPRCGKDLGETLREAEHDSTEVCPHCKLTIGEEGLPQSPECWCWESQLDDEPEYTYPDEEVTP